MHPAANRAASRRRKRFGQHFLHDPRVVARIVAEIAPDQKTPIVEIGPGRGVLTVPLLQKCATLHVIEIDARLASELARRCAGLGDLRIHVGDALDFDFRALGLEPLKLVGNLPYRVSTPLLFHLLDQAAVISEMIVMLQQEVVDRLCASVGTHTYGRLSVMVQARCEVHELFSVGRGAFSPPPAVESAVVRMAPRDAFIRSLKDEALFQQVVKTAFGQRRKMLRNALRELLPEAENRLPEIGIDPDARAQNLTVRQFGAIADRLAEMKSADGRE